MRIVRPLAIRDFKNLLFDYEHEDPKERQIGEPDRESSSRK